MLYRKTNNHLIKDSKCKSVLAYYGNYATRVIGVDIDCHNGEGNLYVNNILLNLGTILPKPSIITDTPRGKHVYWILDAPFCLSTITDGVRTLLNKVKLNLEIIPSSTKITRMPTLNDIIYPLTKSFQGLTIYNINELIEPEHALPARQRTRMAKAEADYKIIEKGATNEALCHLAPIYRSLNLSPERSYKRLMELLSPKYEGDFRETAYERVLCFYKNHRTGKSPIETVEHRLHKAITAYVPKSKFKERKVETIYAFAQRVAHHVYNIHTMKEDKQLLTEFGFKYPGARKHLAMNEIPMPSALLKTFNSSYNKYMDVLIKIGFISPATKYSTQFHTCKYFNINYTLLSHKIEIIAPNASNYDQKFVKALEEKYSTNAHDIAMFRKYSKHFRKNKKPEGIGTPYAIQKKIVGNKKTHTNSDIPDISNIITTFNSLKGGVRGLNGYFPPHTTFYNVRKSTPPNPAKSGYYAGKLLVFDGVT